MKNVSIKHLQLFEDRSDVACRVVIKTIGSQVEGMRGGHGMRMVAAMGDIWVAMRSAMKSPQTPDCRGGVFAVFAKIPPPIPSLAAHPIEASFPCGDVPHGPVGGGALVAACRVVIKTGGSMGGTVCAWRRRQWALLGCNADRNDIPAIADCRGGVFAVFAKIPPPT